MQNNLVIYVDPLHPKNLSVNLRRSPDPVWRQLGATAPFCPTRGAQCRGVNYRGAENMHTPEMEFGDADTDVSIFCNFLDFLFKVSRRTRITHRLRFPLN